MVTPQKKPVSRCCLCHESEGDDRLYLITDDTKAACEEIVGFYSNYHSIRYVGDRLVIRLRTAVAADALERINADFGDLAASGRIEATKPLPPEVSDADNVDLPRVMFRYGPQHFGKLRPLIDALNTP